MVSNITDILSEAQIQVAMYGVVGLWLLFSGVSRIFLSGRKLTQSPVILTAALLGKEMGVCSSTCYCGMGRLKRDSCVDPVPACFLP